ncbi:MAG: MDR family MFS transporter [Nocardioides sp.]
MTTNTGNSNTDSVSAGTHAVPGEYSHKQVLTILTGLLLGMFLGSLDQTIVSTSIRTIADDLHGLAAQAWVTTAYLITSTITTPIYGKLGDLWGRKKLFMFAISVFIVGSVMCSFATSMYQLAAFRAFQGLGAGGLFTLVLAIIGDIVSPRERAKYTGYFMATFATSSVLGPVIGGFFAGAPTILGLTGWRWVFMVNVPIGIVALIVVFRTLHVHHVRRPAPIDWMGAAALVVALVPLLTVAEQGQKWGWGTGRSIACFVIGAVGVVAFLAAEARMGRNALIPLGLFKIKAASVTVVASVVVGAALFGGMMMLPLYLQIVHGASPTKSGLLMLPMVLGMMTAALISGKITSVTGKPRIFPIFGSAIFTVGMLLLAQITADTHLWLVMAFMLILGYGVGNCMQPLLLTMQSAVPPQAIGMATSSATFFRQIGGTIGVAVFLSILFGTVGSHIGDAFGDAARTPAFSAAMQKYGEQAQAGHQSPNTELVRELKLQQEGRPLPSDGIFATITDDSSVINGLDPVLAHPFKVGFAQSIVKVFWIVSGIGVLAFLVLLLMPDVELRDQSAAAAAAAQRAAAAESAG